MRLLVACTLLAFCCTACSTEAQVGTVQWVTARGRKESRALPVTPFATPTFAAAPGGSRAEGQSPASGASLYAANCAPCHRSNGEGNLDGFPPLNSSPLVTARMPEPLIETVLYGRRIMPAFSPTLNDVELAAVLSYVRQAWNNQAAPVDPEEVRAVRLRGDR